MNRSLARHKDKARGMLSSLVVSAACSGCYSFNNLYKEWVTNDDKDCSIIPIKLRRYWKKNKVIEINIILLLLLI